MLYLHYLDAIFRSRTFFCSFFLHWRNFILYNVLRQFIFGSVLAFCESNPIFPHIKRLSNRQRPYQTSYYTKEFQLVSRREKNVSAKVLAKKRSSLIVCIVIAILTTMFTGLCSFRLFFLSFPKKS